MAFPKTQSSARLPYIDWMRGLAAVIMIQGHAFHAFTKPELRASGPYVFSQFVGGMPPAIFLFLVGVTLAFLMDSRERKGLAPGLRVLAALKRAGFLFGIAFLFRLQLWLFGWPYSAWTDLLKVDILNAMGLAVAVLSPMAIFQTAERVRLCAALGLAIAGVSPLISQLDWSGVHPLVKAYIAPDFFYFGFFPWASFVAFGMSAGSILRLARAEQIERLMQWGALAGLGLILAGRYFADFPYSVYPASDFWLDSPWLVLIKLGVLLLMLSFAFLWTQYVVRERWSWVRQFGLTSLLVYWVHIELMYGRWLWFWKENLTIGQTAAVAAGFLVLMLALSLLRTQWRNWRLLGFWLGWPYLLRPRRALED
jgi:uncharacterized membrane protein